MNIIHNGKLFLFDKDNSQTNEIFYDKSWFIAKQENNTNEDNIHNKQLANIYINMKYLGCRYSKNVEKQIKL